MQFIFAVLSDAHSSNGLGRVDKASMSDQTLLELVVNGISDISCLQADGIFDNIRVWKGASFDADGTLLRLYWSRHGLRFFPSGGTIDLRWLPETLQVVSVAFNCLEGSVDFKRLPGALVELYISHNELTGVLSLDNLPGNLRELIIDHNRFSGRVTAESLPKSMTSMCLSHNAFSGMLCLVNIPQYMMYITVQENAFDRKAIIGKLPARIQYCKYGSEVQEIVDESGIPQVDYRFLRDI